MGEEYEFIINGRRVTVGTDGRRPLLDVIREDMGLTGAKFGCGEGQCGACTVLVEGEAIGSCNTPVAEMQGKSIQTIEGLGSGGALHAVQQAYLQEGAMQCGYCIPGMIMETVAFLNRKPNPTRADIDVEMRGHLCRCCGYPRIIAAIERAAELMNEEVPAR